MVPTYNCLIMIYESRGSDKDQKLILKIIKKKKKKGKKRKKKEKKRKKNGFRIFAFLAAVDVTFGNSKNI